MEEKISKTTKHTGTELNNGLTWRYIIIITGMGMIETDKNLDHMFPPSAQSLSQRTENIEIGRKHTFIWVSWVPLHISLRSPQYCGGNLTAWQPGVFIEIRSSLILYLYALLEAYTICLHCQPGVWATVKIPKTYVSLSKCFNANIEQIHKQTLNV